jgi:hypothetical protein
MMHQQALQCLLAPFDLWDMVADYTLLMFDEHGHAPMIKTLSRVLGPHGVIAAMLTDVLV